MNKTELSRDFYLFKTLRIKTGADSLIKTEGKLRTGKETELD